MSMHIDGKKVTAMYWGGLKIREAWYGGERVFSGKPVEVMPPTPGTYDARDWLRAKLTEYGEDYRTVEEIPFEIDSSQVTNMSNMFRGCSSLTDGNVRLIGKHPGVSTVRMIRDSGLTREPFYDSSGQPI